MAVNPPEQAARQPACEETRNDGFGEQAGKGATDGQRRQWLHQRLWLPFFSTVGSHVKDVKMKT